MKKTINDLKKLILDEEKDISLMKKLSQKNINILLLRIKKNIHDINKYTLSSIIIAILSDIDNLEKSFNLSSSNTMLAPIATELKNILELFSDLFHKYHITTINESNVIFNPSIHQAIAVSESKDIEPNHVIEVMQKGYKLYERILRPAMVIVSK